MQNYKHEESFFNASNDGLRIYYQWYIPEKTERIIVIQHGFGEHSGRYENLVRHFSGSNTAFYMLDSRGHGHSEGARGHVNEFTQYREDLADFINIVQQKSGGQKIILLGHSLGGVVVADYAVSQGQSDLQALIFSSAAFQPVLDIEKSIKKTVGEVLSIFAPAVTVDAGLDAAHISHDKNEVRRYINDPLVHSKISLKMGTAFFKSGEELLKEVHKITVPVYMMHGSGDMIAESNGTERAFQAVSSKKKNLKIYDGLYHEMMNEKLPEREKVLDELKDWVMSL